MDERVTVAREGGARVGEEVEGGLFQFKWWDHTFRVWTIPESVLHITWMKYQTVKSVPNWTQLSDVVVRLKKPNQTDNHIGALLMRKKKNPAASNVKAMLVFTLVAVIVLAIFWAIGVEHHSPTTTATPASTVSIQATPAQGGTLAALESLKVVDNPKTNGKYDRVTDRSEERRVGKEC